MQTPAADRLEVRPTALIQVGAEGVIESVTDDATAPVDFDLGPDVVIMPGLIDTHVHAPQWPQTGTGLDLDLERWLLEYTLPLERRYRDLGFAARVWDDLVPTLIAGGTTTAVYYGTIDIDATTLLAEACHRHGQRAFVGRVAMDHPVGTPEWYRDASPSAAIDASLRSIDAIDALATALVRPILTPRFAPACTDALLQGMGELATANGVAVQTHCSESDWEHRYALERFGTTDTMALDRFGLLRDRTVLAHCGHVDDADLAVMRDRNAGIAHCPLSNAYFGDAVLPVRHSIEAGVRVGLGSDLAGGFEPCILAQASKAVTASRMLQSGTDPTQTAATRGRSESSIDSVTAFWMATAGGAQLLQEPTGLIEPGRPFDAFTIDLGAANERRSSGLRWWPELDDHRRVFEKIVNTARPSDIGSVWIDGRLVKAGA